MFEWLSWDSDYLRACALLHPPLPAYFKIRNRTRWKKKKKENRKQRQKKKKNWKECWSSVSQVPKDPYTTEGDGRRGVIMMERRIVMIMLTPLWISPPPCLLFPPPPWCNQVERRITIYIYIFFWDLFFVSLFVCRWVFFFPGGGARGPVMDREALFSARALSSPLLWEFREFASPFGNCVAPPPPPFPPVSSRHSAWLMSVCQSLCLLSYIWAYKQQTETHTHTWIATHTNPHTQTYMYVYVCACVPITVIAAISFKREIQQFPQQQ